MLFFPGLLGNLILSLSDDWNVFLSKSYCSSYKNENIPYEMLNRNKPYIRHLINLSSDFYYSFGQREAPKERQQVGRVDYSEKIKVTDYTIIE